MTLSKQESLDLRALIAQKLDAELTSEQGALLKQMLATNPEARRICAGYNALYALLELEVAALPSEDMPRQLPVEMAPTETCSPTEMGHDQTVLPPSSLGFLTNTLHGTIGYISTGWPMAYLVATVIFGVGLVIGSITYVLDPAQVAERLPMVTGSKSTPGHQREFVGQITGMVDCQWAGESSDATDGARVLLGRKFALASGLLEMKYNSGAKVILQGPVTYEVESKNGGYLSLGKLTARVETKADKTKGHKSPLFSIRTPTATVTDLGTEFGVEVTDKGESKVYVFVGTVNVVDHNQRYSAKIATAGEVVYASHSEMWHSKSAELTNQFVRTIHSPILLSDNFNDNSLDSLKWTAHVDTPSTRGNAGIVERNGRIELTNRGYLVTKRQYNPDRFGGIIITGQWTFRGSEDTFHLFTRSDVLSAQNQLDETIEGLEFSLSMAANENEPVLPDITCRGDGLSLQHLRTMGSLHIQKGDTFAFIIIDKGTLGVSLTLTQVGDPSNKATVRGALNFHNTTHNYVVFHNRASGKPGYDTACLDDVAIAVCGESTESISPILVGYWSFSGTADDQSGSGNHGICTDTTYSADVPSQIANHVRQSIGFNGTSSDVIVPVRSTSSSLYIDDAVTISLWMKATNTEQAGFFRRIFSNIGSDNHGFELQQMNTTAALEARIVTSGRANQCHVIGKTAFNGTWHHIAIVADSTGTLSTYYDGIKTMYSFHYGDGFNSSDNLCFGNGVANNNKWYKGLLSDAAIWHGMLTDAQIAGLASGALTPLTVVNRDRKEPSGLEKKVNTKAGGSMNLIQPTTIRR